MAVKLPELSTVNFLLVVLTVVILSAGTVEPTAYGEVPALVTMTWYFSDFAVVEEALERFAPDSTDKAGESDATNVCASYSLRYEYEKSAILLWVMYCCPNGKIKGSNEASVKKASEYVEAVSFDLVSMSAELTLVVEENVANDSTSLNSKSIAQTEVLVGVVTKFVSNVITWLVASNAVINFGDSVEPEPEVILNFAPLYASVTDEKIWPAVVLPIVTLPELADLIVPVNEPTLTSNKNVL